MKKIFAFLLIACMLFGLAACAKEGADPAKPSAGTANNPVAQDGPFKIGVATIHEGEAWEIQKRYYEDEVGPALNMEFMYSEKISDANGLVDFMDKAYAAGCVGIINYQTSDDAIAQGARKAEEWGVYFITQSSRLNEDVAQLAYNLGHCGASAEAAGAAYSRAYDAVLSDGKPHGVFIFSGAAVGGKIGQGAASHYYSVAGILESLQEAYQLEFEQSIDDIINNQNPGEVNTGNPNVKIYIYPGLDVNAALTSAQTQLQTGDYDIFSATFNYPAFTTMIDDVEKSLKKDIRIIATANIEQQTETGFTTMDSTGAPILTSAIINPLNVQGGICSVLLYNALTGHAEAMKDNGKALLFGVEMWTCPDAATYQGIGQMDSSVGKYVLGANALKALCVDQNPEVSYKDVQGKLLALGDVNAVIKEIIG